MIIVLLNVYLVILFFLVKLRMSGLMLFSQYDPQAPQSSMARSMTRGTNWRRDPLLRSKGQKRLFIKHFMRAADDDERDAAPLESLAMEAIEQ